MADTALSAKIDSGKAKPDLVDAKYMLECFTYCPETGHLFWKVRPLNHFKAPRYMKSANSRWAGMRAFTTVDDKGYASGRVRDKLYRAHRIIAVAFMRRPDGWVDHINGIRTDNRIKNLRIVDAVQNAQNQRKAKNNTSGVTGISYVPKLKRWNANIGGSNLGNFRCIARAIAARRSEECRLGYHENHGRSE